MPEVFLMAAVLAADNWNLVKTQDMNCDAKSLVKWIHWLRSEEI